MPFFKLNLTEHEIVTAHVHQISSNLSNCQMLVIKPSHVYCPYMMKSFYRVMINFKIEKQKKVMLSCVKH